MRYSSLRESKGLVVVDSYAIMYIMLVHWVADFVMQTAEMVKGKSSSNRWLLAHTSTYTIVMAVLTLNPIYALVNGVLHTVVDYITSRWSSKLWVKGDVHNFFVVIGLDQLIHVVTLIATYKLLWH